MSSSLFPIRGSLGSRLGAIWLFAGMVAACQAAPGKGAPSSGPAAARGGAGGAGKSGAAGAGGSGGGLNAGGTGPSGSTGGAGAAATGGGGAAATGGAGSESDAGPLNDAGPTEDAGPATDAPATTISQGCGKPAPAEGLHEITVGAAQRKFFLRVPGSYDGKKAWPVIFAFHGAGNKSAAWFDTNTDLRAVTEDKAVLVFGEGARRPDGTLSWVHLSPDNVLFVDAMIDWLKQNACIDPSHLFAVGQSSGGYMAMTLGCQRGNVFRGVATSSGGILEPGTCTGRPAAVWMRTGRGDTVETRQSVEVTRDFWVKHKTCAADAPKPTTPAPCVKWSGCQDDAAVIYCEDGGGHDWPSYYSRGLLEQFSGL
jgi:polyhydroxybutyrate depolymerase